MSIVVQMKGGKDHIVKWIFSLGKPQLITMCGKEVRDGSKIIESAPRVDLCKNCYEWIGKQMVSDWLGLDFFTETKTSIYCADLRREE